MEAEILACLGDLDTALDGELGHSENYQALNTLLPKYKERVKCIYIDRRLIWTAATGLITEQIIKIHVGRQCWRIACAWQKIIFPMTGRYLCVVTITVLDCEMFIRKHIQRQLYERSRG